MSTLAEIEAAAKALPIKEQRELLISIAARLRAEEGTLPEPREFAQDHIQTWVHRDEFDLKRFREKP